MYRRITFMCETFDRVSDTSWSVTGETWLGPIEKGDCFDFAMDPFYAEHAVSLAVESIVVGHTDGTADLPPGSRGALVLRGTASPDIASGWLLGGEPEPA